MRIIVSARLTNRIGQGRHGHLAHNRSDNDGGVIREAVDQHAVLNLDPIGQGFVAVRPRPVGGMRSPRQNESTHRALILLLATSIDKN
jgi:hypothetical protein